ncbi:hypothetical protein [Bailinhaonella thermotolerans]|uniref:Uncharacterized protein n=1 Tax=Bailinhaonella thermotolerans TaxID=1070861 RepID=A0A3A4A5W9_9ACTN|nr:hypothetical protein [Bailinhaonella thermotolerans]RJL21053.1 hypothetical protein D5H75_38210 [Bailinhaonella thermotolerans]
MSAETDTAAAGAEPAAQAEDSVTAPRRRAPRGRRTIGGGTAALDKVEFSEPVSPQADAEWAPTSRPAPAPPALPDTPEKALQNYFALLPTFDEPEGTPAEQLAACERAIRDAAEHKQLTDRYMRRYIAASIGGALAHIQEHGLVPNFEVYAEERFGYKRAHAYRLIEYGRVVRTWPDLELDWSFRQTSILGPLIKKHGPDKARAVFDLANAEGDIGEAGLKRARTVLGLGEPKQLEQFTGEAPKRVRSTYQRYEVAVRTATQAAESMAISDDARRKKLRDLVEYYPEGAAALLLDTRRILQALQDLTTELEADVPEDILDEVVQRRTRELESGQ